MSDIIIDNELPKALAYFLIYNSLRVRETSVEMLFSKGYDNHWTLSKINWEKLKATNPVDIEELN